MDNLNTPKHKDMPTEKVHAEFVVKNASWTLSDNLKR